jgi:DNA-binding Lrp family transcriptional regulator
MPLSAPIITAIRSLPQLKGSLKLTALELAHLASRSGVARVAYWVLAKKTGQSVRTMIRHVHRLVELGVITKQVMRLTLTRCAVNQYRFLVGVPPCPNVHVTSWQREVPQKGKIFAREAESDKPPTLTPAGRRFLEVLRRLYPLTEPS